MTLHPSYDDPRPWLRSKLRRAWLVLAWERTWRASWAAVGAAGLFLAVALLDILPSLPGWAHATVIAIFGASVLVLAVHGWWTVRLPSRADAVRRLERTGSHRPLSALDDRLAADSGDAQVRALWQAHLARMTAEAKRLEPGLPSPGVAARDPWGLRAAVVLLLVIGAAAAWGHVSERLARAASPAWTMKQAAPISVRLWITPPDYTGLRPLILEADGSGGAKLLQDLSIPVGSTVLALVQGGGDDVPTLAVGERVTPLAVLGDGSYRLESTIDAGTRLTVARDGRILARWGMTVVADAPPSIAFAKAPTEAGRWRLRVEYRARDDYGIAAVGTLIERDGVGSPGTPVELPLPLPGSRPKTVKSTSLHDLTAHPWAGLTVTMRPFARDGNGQIGVGDPQKVRLPERVFMHPVARAISEQRKKILTEPEHLGEVIAALDAIADEPQSFNGDLVVYLSLRVARNRIASDASEAGTASVRDILWQTALRLEEGESAIAERALEDAERALTEALSRDAGTEEMERLIERYREAMEQYLSALAQKMGPMDARMPIPPDRMMRADQFDQMLDRLRDLARAGSKDAARRLMGQMQQMMQSLRSARLPNEMQDAMKEMRSLMEGMKALVDRQQALLDQTFRQSQDTRRAVDRDRMRAGAQAQETLRRDLGAMMEKLAEAGGGGTLPDNLGKAELAMRDAAERLNRGDAGKAADAQGKALHELREGGKAAAQQMMERMMAGSGAPALFPGTGMSGDPLGRQGGMVDDGTVAIPTQPETRNAREILDELRRRSAEQSRAPNELEYLNRLLRQF